MFSNPHLSPIYRPFKPFGRGTTPVRGQQLTMIPNHLLNGILQRWISPVRVALLLLIGILRVWSILQAILGGLRSPWLSTTYIHWDDPPSKGGRWTRQGLWIRIVSLRLQGDLTQGCGTKLHPGGWKVAKA